MYSLSAETTAIYALDAIVLGIAAAAINAVGPVFVLGANLPQKVEASRLTILNLLQPVGQVIGGAILALAVTAGLDYSARFLIAAGFMLVCAVLTWFTTGKPAQRIVLQEDKPVEHREEQKQSFGLALLLLLLFLWPVERKKKGISS